MDRSNNWPSIYRQLRDGGSAPAIIDPRGHHPFTGRGPAGVLPDVVPAGVVHGARLGDLAIALEDIMLNMPLPLFIERYSPS